MSQPGDDPQARTGDDPADVEPTDNSSGAPVDLDRVEAIEDELHER
jgi:hypothetical protein